MPAAVQFNVSAGEAWPILVFAGVQIHVALCFIHDSLGFVCWPYASCYIVYCT